MVKSRTQAKIPYWLREKPTGAMQTALKAHSYQFVSTKALRGEEYDSPAGLIPEYVEYLSTRMVAYSDIKKAWMKTSYAFMSGMRDELRNKIDKVNKDIEKGHLIVPSQKDEASEEEDQEDDEADENEGEEEAEEEQEEEQFDNKKSTETVKPEATGNR